MGNIISPYEVIDKYGADVLRYYMCEMSAGENANFNWDDIKIKQKNLEILCNISKFILDLRKQAKRAKSQDIEEAYILSKKNAIIEKVTELMEEYKIDEIVREIETLFLELSRVYIKLTREKVSSQEAGKVLDTVEDVYKDVLKIFSVVCPFITDHLYRKTFGKESVHLCSWPKSDKKKINTVLEKNMQEALKIIEIGFASRDKEKIGLKWPLSKATIYYYKKFDKDLDRVISSQLNVKKLEWKHAVGVENWKIEFDTKSTPELEAEGYAREMTRKIQDFRKNLGLNKKDKVETIIITDDKVKKILEKQKEFIKEKTNSRKLEIVVTSKERFKNKKLILKS